MTRTDVSLEPLHDPDRDRFIRDNQDAFNYGALQEFGLRDDRFEEPGEIISRRTIEESIDSGMAFWIVVDGENVGGTVVKVEGRKGNLELLFISPEHHSKGIGYAAWCAIERMFPDVEIWETCTPYFEKRNIHFYINRCGFSIVEFFNKMHPDPNRPDDESDNDGMFRFEKRMR